jgi:hypothetical protein
MAIREWALESGVELPSRGRIAGGVLEAYDAGDGDALFAGVGLEREPEKPSSGVRRQDRSSVRLGDGCCCPTNDSRTSWLSMLEVTDRPSHRRPEDCPRDGQGRRAHGSLESPEL